jgi:hypothetical protein
MMILALAAACSAPAKHPPNTDTVSLLRTVVKYASDTLKVGPRIVIARMTKSNPDGRLSQATQQALVASDSTLSAVERYDIARQVCDTVGKTPAFCHFANADGMIAVREIQLWRDSARVKIEYYRTSPVPGNTATEAAPPAAAGKKILVYSSGEAAVARDVNGHWLIRKFTETPGSTKP